jgi:RimJ/RimL family protein N-acetyltransferase
MKAFLEQRVADSGSRAAIEFRAMAAAAIPAQECFPPPARRSAATALRTMTTLLTPRLRLEPCSDAHLPGLFAMNSDPQVMRYISGRAETLDETRAMVERVQRRWIDTGYSWWSFIDRASGAVVGAGCVQHLRREAAPEPDPACPLETGWRLRRDHWGRGLASEAARAMAAFAFDTLQAPELLAVCDPANTASSSVMTRLGMRELGLQTWYGKPVATYGITAAAWGGQVVDPARG